MPTMDSPIPTPRYVSRVTRSENWTSAGALVKSLARPRHPWQLSLAKALAYKVVHHDPSHITRNCQRAISYHPFLYSRDLIWDPEHNVALYVCNKTEPDVYEIDRHLVDGTCELFKRHPTPADPVRYLGTFRLVEGVFPYTGSQTDFCRHSVKAHGSTPRYRPTGIWDSHEFAILERVGWNDTVVQKLGAIGLMQLVADEAPPAEDSN